MSFHLQSNTPVWHELAVLFGPDSMQIGECRVIDYARYRAVHPLPPFGERRIGLSPCALLSVGAAFEKSVHFADRDLIGRARQQISPFRSPARFHKATLFQTGQNQ